MEDKNWEYDLEEYIRQGEPEQVHKSEAWKTAIGLQDVDGLKTSDYLLQTAKENIEGKIDIKSAQRRIESYYEEAEHKRNIELETKEADIVSARITEILSEKTFQFSPVEWKAIHGRLFAGVFSHAGKIRDYNITKKEWVLNGDTVIYSAFDSINETLDYDFKMEKEFSYNGLSSKDAIKHIVKFASDIWQIHPFCEGNTRATAVFIIKYLKTFRFDINNDIFAKKSWYFRNALVRANYNNLQKGISSTTKYLELFFENLLLGYENELKNRYLHIDYVEEIQSANLDNSKCKNCTLEEVAILKIISANPAITQKELAEQLGKSERTIKTRTIELQEKGYIRRTNGKRNGIWEVLIEIA